MTILPDLTQIKTLLNTLIDYVGDLASRVAVLEKATPVTVPVTPTPAPVPAPVPAATAGFTVITGAKIDGVIHVPATLDVLVNALKAGSVLTLPAGHFLGTTVVKVPCTIAGAGKGVTIIDCTGLVPVMDKGIFVPLVAGLILKDMSLTGAHISAALGGNAAGVRAQFGESFDWVNVDAYHNDTAMLTLDGSVTLNNCNIHENGFNAQTHEVYFGEAPLVDVKNCTFKCGAGSTHAFKSRAQVTNIANCILIGNPDPTGAIGGSVLDVPEAGAVNVSNSSLTISAGAANHMFFGYAMENQNQVTHGTTVTMTNVVFTDGNNKGGMIQSHISNATLILTGCTYTADVPPQITGWGSVQGTIAKAA